MDSDTNSEDMNEEYIQQVIAEEMEIDELVLVVARTSVYYHNNFLVKEPCRNSPHTGWKFMMEIMDGNGRRCHEMFQMEKHVFCKLCDRLRRNRMIQEHFQHSGETVSRQFSNVLEKISMLALDAIRPPENFDEVSYYIRNNHRYWSYFKDCIGAIDGTHVRVSLPVDKQIPYIGRKGCPTQNIMAVCGFDMLFTFVWASWEGTTHDTRTYYLVDAGYPNMKGYLAPYKGQRYYLLQFQQGSQPSSSKEVFNHAHSSLRSVIERCFGVWKARWELLQRMPNYKFDKQVTIVTASIALHNFIRRETINDIEFPSCDEANDDFLNDDNSNINLVRDKNEMRVIRDKITTELMLR
ncbi:uncharacterized protein LOC133816997 [Humulus lupulus]|uniref:uncharacterized protein LOC133816997 n=1 Tax=Humulus lupulus TaxID=3486 RepID=UPI002B413E9D|nr:uncharacterized protein LOC133816997 [Humulus lupulus]